MGAISIEAAPSPTASHCWCELKESVNQLSLVCVRLPFSEMWERGGKVEREQYSTYHRRKLGPECFCVQNTKRKKTPTEKEGSLICFYRRLYTICCYPNFREHWFPRNWIWGAIFFHFTFSSVCLKSGYWNPSCAALFSAHLEGI